MGRTSFANGGEGNRFIETIGQVDFESFQDDASRRQALAAARALARRLETPMDATRNIDILDPALYSALKVAGDLGIFDTLDQDNGRPKTTTELAGSANPDVVKRMLRHMASMNFVTQPGPDNWAPTELSSALRSAEVFAPIDYFHDVAGPALMGRPEYLKSTGYKDPADAANGNWQFVTKTPLTFFQWMAEHAESQKTFWSLMKGHASQPGSWVDVYPTQDLLVEIQPETPLVVDIGGAKGQDLQTLLEKYPETAGKLICQDQGPVIKDVERHPVSGLQTMVHDFFASQPVKGARVYFMHRILHDWPDDKGREILANIKSAMAKGYSRLLINEVVLPRKGANWHQTSVDIMMMGLLSSRERSEEAWGTFLQSAGFRVVKFWQSMAAYDSVIEADLL